MNCGHIKAHAAITPDGAIHIIEEPEMNEFAELEQWWLKLAQTEVNRTIPKAVEYSSTDLVDIGRGMLGSGMTDADYAEAGVAFYAYGKCARIIGAIREGRKPSADSWFDLGVYARMAQRIQEKGGWPNG